MVFVDFTIGEWHGPWRTSSIVTSVCYFKGQTSRPTRVNRPFITWDHLLVLLNLMMSFPSKSKEPCNTATLVSEAKENISEGWLSPALSRFLSRWISIVCPLFFRRCTACWIDTLVAFWLSSKFSLALLKRSVKCSTPTISLPAKKRGFQQCDIPRIGLHESWKYARLVVRWRSKISRIDWLSYFLNRCARRAKLR